MKKKTVDFSVRYSEYLTLNRDESIFCKSKFQQETQRAALQNVFNGFLESTAKKKKPFPLNTKYQFGV